MPKDMFNGNINGNSDHQNSKVRRLKKRAIYDDDILITPVDSRTLDQKRKELPTIVEPIVEAIQEKLLEKEIADTALKLSRCTCPKVAHVPGCM